MMKNITQRLKKIRNKLELTQEKLGKEFNFSKSIYSNLETGKRNIQLEDIEILKNKFNINPNWLLFGEGEEEYCPTPKELELSNLILDFRRYGGEANIVRIEIIKKILLKFYAEKNLFGFKRASHNYGHRVHHIFIKVLKNAKFNDMEKNAKSYLTENIKMFNDNSPFLEKVKKELYTLVNNLDNKDCNYLLRNADIAIDLVTQKISI